MSSLGRGGWGSTNTSIPPSEAQVVTSVTTPGRLSSRVAPGGRIFTSRGRPSRSAAIASRATIGSEQAPPIHPSRRPSGVTIALSPTRAETGRSTATTVASAYASPRPVSSDARRRVSLLKSALARPPRHLALWIASHTLAEVTGMSILRIPVSASASTTALTNAAGDPTVADSPTPLAPIG
jgi:hypothetical protein